MKMKLFQMMNIEKKGIDFSDFEKEVNAWLQSNPNVTVKHIEQSTTGGSWANSKLIITVWFE